MGGRRARADAATERRWEAMGTWAQAVVVGVARPERWLDRIVRRVDDLEQRWSRFRPDSEVTRANRRPGERVEVSAATVDLVRRAAQGREATAGWFDPCRLDALVAAGYDRPFGAPGFPGPGGSAPGGPADIETLTWGDGWVSVPLGGFDPGGIGKGLAADLVAEEAQLAGVAGVLVNLGGDLCCRGQAPPGHRERGGWWVDVTGPRDEPHGRVVIGAGGVATSTPHRRRWADPAGHEAHHLLDPGTGAPAAHPRRSATVLASDAWAAEVLATAACVAPLDAAVALVEANAASALLVGPDGDEVTAGGFEGYRR